MDYNHCKHMGPRQLTCIIGQLSYVRQLCKTCMLTMNHVMKVEISFPTTYTK
jgi:hypothetical protein